MGPNRNWDLLYKASPKVGGKVGQHSTSLSNNRRAHGGVLTHNQKHTYYTYCACVCGIGGFLEGSLKNLTDEKIAGAELFAT